MPYEVQEQSSFVTLIQFSPKLLTFYAALANLCFDSDYTAIVKRFATSFFGLSVMMFLLLFYLVPKSASALCKKPISAWNTYKGCLTEAFVLTTLFSYQQLVAGAFSLVQCVTIRNGKRMYINANMNCYTWWQILMQIYIFCGIIPGIATLSLVPFEIESKKLSVSTFILVCLLPGPYLVLFTFRHFFKRHMSDLREKHKNQENCDEVKPDFSDSARTVLHSLLDHYQTLTFMGVRFTWLGVHKLFRVLLVACNTYITEPLWRLAGVTVAVLIMLVSSTLVKPYKDKRANLTSAFSYSATLVVAMINFGKAFMLTFESQRNMQLKVNILALFDLTENILIVYVPIAACLVWVLASAGGKCAKMSVLPCKERKKKSRENVGDVLVQSHAASKTKSTEEISIPSESKNVAVQVHVVSPEKQLSKEGATQTVLSAAWVPR